MKTPTPQFIDVSAEKMDAVLLQVKTNCDEQSYQLVKAMFGSYQLLLKTLEQGRGSIRRLRKMIFGPKTEKSKDVVDSAGSSTTTEATSVEPNQPQASPETKPPTGATENKPKRRGHGRRSAAGYPGAKRNIIPHPTLKSGDPCPQCEQGKVYDNVEPKVILRFTGQAPINVTIWELEKLRCNLCGTLFTAPQPTEMGPKRWDETAKAMLGLSRYGAGMPFNRLANLQANLGMPLPASTQWEAVSAGVLLCKPAYDELVRQAAQGKVFFNDDTSARILEYMKRVSSKADSACDAKAAHAGAEKEEGQAGSSEKKPIVVAKARNNDLKDILKNEGEHATKSGEDCPKMSSGIQGNSDCNNTASEGESTPLDIAGKIPLSRRKGKETKPDERKGVQTTGIISDCNGKNVALFLTGKKHAGENLDDVLNHRAKGLSPPTLMCDALTRNLPKRLAVLLANCMAHARRGFVEVFVLFPEQCRHLLEQLATVYHNDDIARNQTMSDDERLAFHQCKSKPIMDALKKWLDAQILEKLVEPNSSLGSAIEYMRNHWDALTLFLKVAGAPLDNNVVERALKKAILSRKNSLFFKTQHGADVGDIYMSFIYTCELNGINAFDYLTSLMRHPQEVADSSSDWMPWNYQQTLRRKQAA